MSALDLGPALAIPGWMDPSELAWLAIQAQAATISIEVGSWKGRSTKALADHTPGRLYAVDHWRGSAPELWQEIAARGPDSIFQDFLRHLALAVREGRVIPLRMESANAAVVISDLDRLVDFVFLDGDHTDAGCKADIDAYRPLVRDGGVLAGHDYGNPHWPGVKRAVDAAFPSVHRAALSIWWARL